MKMAFVLFNFEVFFASVDVWAVHQSQILWLGWK